MERLRVRDVVEEVYRVDSVIEEGPSAHIYGVTHLRAPDVPLAMKVAVPNRALDFDRDTSAMGSLTGPSFVRIVDRGKLPDGRLYRVMERLAGPSLRSVLAEAPFGEDRAMELLVSLAAAVHEVHAAGMGPCDLSLDNLMFADGRDGVLCLVRVIVPFASGPDADADQRALDKLKGLLVRGMTRLGGSEPPVMAWKPPSSLAEIRAAISSRSGRHTPAPSGPGGKISRWEVVRRISDTLAATVYEVTGPNRQQGILKVPGPQADHTAFTKHADLLARVQSRNVVRVVDFGETEGTPFMVMDPLHIPQSTRLEQQAPLSIDAALQTVDELLWGAEAINKYGGSPSDFSLDNCYQASREPSPAVLTRAMLHLRSSGLFGRPSSPDHTDAWSAAVALYELIAARLPFPTSKHALAKAWMGLPIPLTTRRHDVSSDISELVHAVLTGRRVTTADLRREITRIRSAPGAIKRSAPPERVSVTPAPEPAQPEVRGQARPRVFAPTEHALERATPPPIGMPALGAVGSASLRTLVDDAGPILPMPIAAFEAPPDAERSGRRSIEPPRLAASDLPEWDVRLADVSCPLDALDTAAFSADGAEIVATSGDAVARFKNGQWTVGPARLGSVALLALAPMGDGFLATTSSGPLLRLGPSGAFSPWGVALERFAFHAVAQNDPSDGLTLVGCTKDRSRGVVAKLAGESLTIVTDNLEVKPLRAATYLPDGGLLAATQDGTIVVLRGGTVAEGIRPANVTFLAAGVVGSDIVVVGAGAWAFRITTSPLAAALEPVDTLSALTCISIADRAWAGTDKGRVLCRQEGHWRRMNPSFEGDPPVLAIWASKERMSAVLANGKIVSGTKR